MPVNSPVTWAARNEKMSCALLAGLLVSWLAGWPAGTTELPTRQAVPSQRRAGAVAIVLLPLLPRVTVAGAWFVK